MVDLDAETPAVQTRGRILWSQITWVHSNLEHLMATLPKLRDTLAEVAEECKELRELTVNPDTTGKSLECWHDLAMDSHGLLELWVVELSGLLGGEGEEDEAEEQVTPA